MAAWRVRPFHPDDLESAVHLWDDPAASGGLPWSGITDLISAVREGHPAVVATVDDELVGSAVSRVQGQHGWILRISLSPRWRQRGIGSQLLTELERRLVAAGVRRVSALLGDESDVGAAALDHCGFQVRRGVLYFQKLEEDTSADQHLLDRLGGQRVDPGLWDRLGGMVQEKELIERRVILPLAHPDLAQQTGLVPPRAIVLFGPPGTGKTTFAKGVAARLGWPFVEIFPSRLADGTPSGLASGLAEAFGVVAELEHVVLFIDEVEEIAGRREGRLARDGHTVTNEMLKLIPAFREREGRLLVCATNSVRELDTALLRPGRFDYVIPIGPPDAAARAAIWQRYVDSMPHGGIELPAIVAASELFTPADIDFAARKAAQLVFERAVFGAGAPRAGTEDFLAAITATRRTLTPDMVAEFTADVDRHART
ncbi:MAG: ATP-binding protein [Actinomycetota bacterium]